MVTGRNVSACEPGVARALRRPSHASTKLEADFFVSESLAQKLRHPPPAQIAPPVAKIETGPLIFCDPLHCNSLNCHMLLKARTFLQTFLKREILTSILYSFKRCDHKSSGPLVLSPDWCEQQTKSFQQLKCVDSGDGSGMRSESDCPHRRFSRPAASAPHRGFETSFGRSP